MTSDLPSDICVLQECIEQITKRTDTLRLQYLCNFPFFFGDFRCCISLPVSALRYVNARETLLEVILNHMRNLEQLDLNVSI